MGEAPAPGVLVFLTDAGGGHRAAARTLVAAAEARALPLRLEPVAIQTVLAPRDLWKHLTGRTVEETYNDMVRRGWTVGLVPLLRVLQLAIRVLHRPLVRTAARFLATRQPRPRLVLSVMPNFNAVLRDAVATALPGVPFAVLLTDYADFPHHFWIEPGIDRVIVATETAADQARANGIAEDRISRVSGMLLNPRFEATADTGARERVRRELGLGEQDFVILLLFGGKGSPEMAPLAETLLREVPAARVIAICGDNPRLQRRLTPVGAESGGRLHVLGFTDRVADWMAAADLLMTKPGPGTLAEAFHQRLPVVVIRNARTVPQERFNARLVRELDVGAVVSDWQEMPPLAASLAGDGLRLERWRRRLAALPPNRASQEALAILGGLVRAGETAPPAAQTNGMLG